MTKQAEVKLIFAVDYTGRAIILDGNQFVKDAITEIGSNDLDELGILSLGGLRVGIYEWSGFAEPAIAPQGDAYTKYTGSHKAFYAFGGAGTDDNKAVFEDRRDRMFAEIAEKLNRAGRQRGGQFDCGELGICHIQYLDMGRWRCKWYLTERVEDLD